MTEQATTDLELQKRIEQFSREQSHYYLDRAQMTYWEKLQDKVERTRGKVSHKLDRFKLRSNQSMESQADLTTYMTDFVNDLMAQGLSADEAYAQAAQELAYNSGSNRADELSDRYYHEYFSTFEQMEWQDLIPNGSSAIGFGLYYSGGVLVGSVLGALIGLLIGLNFFVELFWVAVIIGLLSGAIFGVGCAMLIHAHALRKPK